MSPRAILPGFKVTTALVLAYKQGRECEKCGRNTERVGKKGCTIMISEGRGLTSMEKDKGRTEGTDRAVRNRRGRKTNNIRAIFLWIMFILASKRKYFLWQLTAKMVIASLQKYKEHKKRLLTSTGSDIFKVLMCHHCSTLHIRTHL